MILQTLIIECLKIYKISHKIIISHMEDMKNLKVESTAGGKTLAEVKIQREIFL